MQTELYSLSKIFTENLFRIPDYQRGYSWGERQLKEFWSDIELLDNDRDHYTGVLTLEEVGQQVVDTWVDDLWIVHSKRYRPYYVVDGQQRLTTALILLQCILERSGPGTDLNYSSFEEIRKKYIFESRDKGLSRSYVFGYEKDNPSYEYLKTKIFLEHSDAHSIGELTIYTHNLSHAKQFLAEKIAGLDVAGLEQAYTKLTQHFLFNIYVISGSIDVFVAFETMNNRGKPLSHLELLKNRLIFLSTRLPVDEIERSRLRRTINESWKTAYHFLGRNQNRPLADDPFLSTQFLLYAGTRSRGAKGTEEAAKLGTKRAHEIWRLHRDENEYKSYLLDRYFTSRNLSDRIDVPDGEEQTTLTAESLHEYAHDLKRSVETYYRLYNPDDSDFADEVRIQLERIRRLGWRQSLPLAVAVVHRSAPPEELAIFFERLERYLFIQAIRVHYTGALDLLELAVRIARGEETVQGASDKIHAMSEKLVPNLVLSETAVRWAKERAYYGWHGLNYFLFEYEQELKARSKSSRDKLVWEEFSKEVYDKDYATIEHIYPQKAYNAYWTERFRHFTAKRKNAMRNSLGNLLAVSRAKNAALSNRAFPAKRDGSPESGGYRFGSYSEIEVAEQADWTASAILNRGLRMLDFLERRWQIPLGDRKAKVAALKLGFLENPSVDVDSDDDEENDDEESVDPAEDAS